jgi:DNA-binding response OmpR family regulator
MNKIGYAASLLPALTVEVLSGIPAFSGNSGMLLVFTDHLLKSNPMKKILLVDDDMDLLFMLKNALKANGYSVTVLADGSAVLNTIEFVRPDMIILDIHMPPWDGRTICAGIKNTQAYKDIPIVLYSALEEDKEAVTRCKANRFLQKPLSTSAFIDEIKAVMMS